MCVWILPQLLTWAGQTEDHDEKQEFLVLHKCATIAKDLQLVAKLDWKKIEDGINTLVDDSAAAYVAKKGGIPILFMCQVNLRRANILSSEHGQQKQKEWAAACGLTAEAGLWTVACPRSVDNLRQLIDIGVSEDAEIMALWSGWLENWISACFPSIVFNCLEFNACGIQEDTACKTLASTAKALLRELPEPEDIQNYPEILHVAVQSVCLAMDGLRGISEPFPGVSLQAIDFVNPDDTNKCDCVAIFPRSGRGLVTRIKK